MQVIEKPTNYAEKLQVINAMKDRFKTLSEDFQQRQNDLKRKVAEREDKNNALLEEHGKVNAEMEALNTFSEEAKNDMKAAMVVYEKGIEMMKDLSSNDLIALVQLKNPDPEIVAVMNGVQSVLCKAIGWENAVKNVTSKDFMYSIGEVDYEKLQFETVEKVRNYKKQYSTSSVVGKNKSAGAFGTWLEGICLVRDILDDKMADLKERQAKANLSAQTYNENK